MKKLFRDLTNEEIKELIKSAKQELRLRKSLVKNTNLYKKNLVKAKNLRLKIDRTLSQTQFESWQDKNFANKIKKTYQLTKINQKTGTILGKILKGFERDMKSFEKYWKKHYEKAKNAIEYLYEPEKAKKLKEELRTVIYRKTKAEYLINISERALKFKDDLSSNLGYKKMFDAYMEDTYPSETGHFFYNLTKGGYNPTELKKLKNHYKKTGDFNFPSSLNKKRLFERSLRESVNELAEEKSDIYLGNELKSNSYLDDETFDDILL